jgi:hypothetical protein
MYQSGAVPGERLAGPQAMTEADVWVQGPELAELTKVTGLENVLVSITPVDMSGPLSTKPML